MGIYHSTFSPDASVHYYNERANHLNPFATLPDYYKFSGKMQPDKTPLKWFYGIAHRYHWFAVNRLFLLVHNSFCKFNLA